ncbi:glycosyltransferase family 2 protein [Allorhodopirellula solitaria]|uniref:Putative teichuronic acid biosynthesis glycosyltransferase TuaG n=1 Tax=Allorhodopirellula solitaria TaxID=2527987 RepID=A0A5C5YDR8_9BACT|nr:glycosyltransferase family 2 protein [Allorhodopirellula solitaria]TWT72953.1 putative teichuronic acid biosynthesis glycosyltransferase TuaG [Allorhodopirellula solitaria]
MNTVPPRISLITVNYNQAPFIQQTIESVLSQGYPNLEYIVIDGGSTDGSVDIIQKYESQLAYWVSEPDEGQYHAINKGFERASGEVLGWINSDDFLLPGCLGALGSIFQSLPDVQWLTSRMLVICSEYGVLQAHSDAGMSGDAYCENVRRGSNFIQQEQTFWRRSLFDKAVGGQIPTRHSHAADMDLWFHFFQHSDCHVVDIPLACLRQRADQRWRHAAGREQDRVLREEHLCDHGLVTQLRRLVYSAGLQNAPVLRSLLRRTLGYSAQKIVMDADGLLSGDPPSWHVNEYKFL